MDTEQTSAGEGTRLRLVHVAAAVLLAAAGSLLLPEISLDTGFADAVVQLTDTGTWPQLAAIVLIMFIVLTVRPENDRRGRIREAVALAVILPVALAGNGLVNEHVVKPAFGVPRPNIVELADGGVLGPEFPDAESFYAVGDKQARREVLRTRLTPQTTPYLTETVRAQWVYETGYSFPSGHTTASVTFAILLAAFGLQWLRNYRRILAVYLIPIWAITVVYSRVLLQVHRPLDVIAGTFVGIFWGSLAFAALQWSIDR